MTQRRSRSEHDACGMPGHPFTPPAAPREIACVSSTPDLRSGLFPASVWCFESRKLNFLQASPCCRPSEVGTARDSALPGGLRDGLPAPQPQADPHGRFRPAAIGGSAQAFLEIRCSGRRRLYPDARDPRRCTGGVSSDHERTPLDDLVASVCRRRMPRSPRRSQACSSRCRRVRSGRVGRSLPGDHRPRRPAASRTSFLDMGALIATAGVRRERSRRRRARCCETLPYVVSRYAHSEYPDRRCRCASKAALDADRARGHAAPLRRQHRRRGGGERDQGGAAQPRA